MCAVLIEARRGMRRTEHRSVARVTPCLPPFVPEFMAIFNNSGCFLPPPPPAPRFLSLFFFLFQTVLTEEKRVIHALRRGVEKQDYGTVKGLLAQAEKMGLSGEEVKQAQAMRLRIEVGGSVPWLFRVLRRYTVAPARS